MRARTLRQDWYVTKIVEACLKSNQTGTVAKCTTLI